MTSNFMKCKNAKKDCFANRDGACRALSDTNFTNKDGTKKECPFYKPAGKNNDN